MSEDSVALAPEAKGSSEEAPAAGGGTEAAAAPGVATEAEAAEEGGANASRRGAPSTSNMKTANGEAREDDDEVPLGSATPEEGDLDAAIE